VLREQITGIRVIRAFVREPYERRRFAAANDELYDVSLRAGRLMSLTFPTVTGSAVSGSTPVRCRSAR
jgi:ATP-binding cassette, subfamily B, multidrug efflux pump